MSVINKLPVVIAIAAALSSVPAFAAPTHHFANGECFYGQASEAAAAARTVTLTASGQFNAVYGEVLRFVSGDQSFTWQFNGLDGRAVDLQQIAPAGFDARGAVVYVGKNPLTW